MARELMRDLALGDRPPGALLDRRGLLRAGAVGLAGLGLPQLLAGEARAAANGGPRRPGFGRAKSCMLIFLKGGPSHLDTFDPKPDAPAEIRGPFRTIATRVPGIQFSEHGSIYLEVTKDDEVRPSYDPRG